MFLQMAETILIAWSEFDQLSGVNYLMFLQNAYLFELHVTHWAEEWFFIIVDSFMALQMIS